MAEQPTQPNQPIPETIDHLAARVTTVEKQIHDLEDNLEADKDPQKGNDSMADDKEETKGNDSAAETAEDDETQERGQEPDLGAPARERTIMGEAWEGNIKRTYDEYQHLGLEVARDARAAASDARLQAKAFDTITAQILANMAEISRLGAATAIRNADQIATVHANLQQSQINASQTGSTKTTGS